MSLRAHALTIAFTLCFSAPAQPQQPAWRLVDQTTRNETKHLLATSSANTYLAPDGSLARATLQLQCTGHLTNSVTLSAETIFAVKSEATLNLSVRLDDAPVRPVGWANLSLHQILLYNLRDLLPAHRQLTIDVPLQASAPQTLTFDISSLAVAMRDNNCRRRIQ